MRGYRRTAESGPQARATWPPVGSGAGVASGPAEETAALNRFRQNPFHAGGLAELEYQELRLRVPFLPGRARRAAAGFRTRETPGPSRPWTVDRQLAVFRGVTERDGIVET